MSGGVTRRRFLGQGALLSSALLLPRRSQPRAIRRGPLRVAVVGVGNRGHANLTELAKEDVVVRALCDVDRRALERAAQEHGDAAVFADFRELLGTVRDLDAVMVSTPDHTHAPASALALRLGYDVYCEKPLAHSVHEARVLTDLARQRHAVTQMGIQIHAWANYRRMVEIVQSGRLGPVREVHVVCSKAWGGGELPAETPAVPEWLDWDLWLGPAPGRAYHPTYAPANWRRWWAFGNGTLGDMACHYVDLAFWALGLTAPTRVQASGPEPHPETAPRTMSVRYEFPARGAQPAVELTWYDGGARPERLAELGLESWRDGVLFVGERGAVIGDYNRNQIVTLDDAPIDAPIEAPEPSLPDSVGHYKEWVTACHTREATSCGFDYSGPLSEAVLLGNVSFRLGGVALEWDARRAQVTNTPEAAPLLQRAYREGWRL